MTSLFRRPAAHVAAPCALGFAALALAAVIDAPLLTFVIGAAAIGLAGVAAWRVATLAPSAPWLAGPAAARVSMDRRNPTFDGDTGLLTEWYFRLRVDEELARAQRYRHALTMLIVSAGAPEAHETARTAARLYLRKVDFASDLGGWIAVCLPETSREAAGNVVARLRDLVPGATIRVREFPADGASLSALLDENAWRTRPPADDEHAAA